MSALRAQMNPHFIFNSLNSIKTYILKQDTIMANHYLTRFSHLMRMVLKNSKSRLITLADELEALELYIDIEKLRFDNGFESIIEMGTDMDPEEIYIPPMLIQPYVENAIWHGLMHKKEKGIMKIHISRKENTLLVQVDDNGIGRIKSSALLHNETSINKSFGTQITQDRITLIRKSLNIDARVQIKDLYDPDGHPAGTQVHLTIPFLDARTARLMIEQHSPMDNTAKHVNNHPH
jgi:LytS/YehU family sensor histidine kinase